MKHPKIGDYYRWYDGQTIQVVTECNDFKNCFRITFVDAEGMLTSKEAKLVSYLCFSDDNYIGESLDTMKMSGNITA